MKEGTDILITAGALLRGIDFALNDRSAGKSITVGDEDVLVDNLVREIN